MSSECVYITSSSLLQHKVSEVKYIFQEYVEYLLRCTNLEVKFFVIVFCYLLLGNQKSGLEQLHFWYYKI